jgi:hypothetical protein
LFLPESPSNLADASNGASPVSGFSQDIVNFAAFMRFLAPPTPATPTTPAASSSLECTQVARQIFALKHLGPLNMCNFAKVLSRPIWRSNCPHDKLPADNRLTKRGGR